MRARMVFRLGPIVITSGGPRRPRTLPREPLTARLRAAALPLLVLVAVVGFLVATNIWA